jgi:hypothetical protein
LTVAPFPLRPRLFRYAKNALVTNWHRRLPQKRHASVCGAATALRSGCDSLDASLPLRSTFPFASHRPKHFRSHRSPSLVSDFSLPVLASTRDNFAKFFYAREASIPSQQQL